jgi:hypothetical protein
MYLLIGETMFSQILRLMLMAPLLLALASCNLPGSTPDAQATGAISTISALQTIAATLQTMPPTNTPLPTSTPTFIAAAPDPVGTANSAGSGQGKPTVINTTLCWVGPGPAYKVVSSIKPGVELDVRAVGSLPGWLVVSNPVYHDLCWLKVEDVQLPPNFSAAGLPIYNPPPTPGPKPEPKPTATP